MKQISKKILAIALVTAMVLQVVTGLIPTAKQVKAEDMTEPNYLDVAYDFTKMSGDQFTSSGITASDYEGSFNSTAKTRVVKAGSDKISATELWTVSSDKGLTPIAKDGRQFVRLHLGEETEAFELKFEATGLNYGFSLGTSMYIGGNNADPNDVYTVDMTVDRSQNKVYLNGVDESTLAVKNGTALSTDGGVVQTSTALPTDSAKWTVTVLGKVITVSEEKSGVEFSVQMNAMHMQGEISLRAHEGSGTNDTLEKKAPAFNNVSVSYLETAYDFKNMSSDQFASSGITASDYEGSFNSTAKTRVVKNSKDKIAPTELWTVSSDKGLTPIATSERQFVRAHIGDETEAYEFKFEATGRRYGVSIGTTQYIGGGNGVANDTQTFDMSVNDSLISLNGVDISTLTLKNDKATKNDSVNSEFGGSVTISAINRNTATKWTITVVGKDVTVCEKVSGAEFSVRMHENHQIGMISLRAQESSSESVADLAMAYSCAYVNYPREEQDPEGTYTFTKKIYQNKLHEKGVTASNYAGSFDSGVHSRPEISNPQVDTADDFWSISSDKGLTPIATDSRQFIRAHIADEKVAFEFKFEAYGNYYGASIGTTAYMGAGNGNQNDTKTFDMYVNANNVLLNGIDINTLRKNNELCKTSMTYDDTHGGSVNVPGLSSFASTKWTITVVGMDMTISEENTGASFSVRMHAEHQKGKISLNAHEDNATHFATTNPGFYSASVTYQSVDKNLTMFDNLALSDLEGWTSRIYNTSSKEITKAESISEQWFTGVDKYTDLGTVNNRNNPGLKPIQKDNATQPHILTSPEGKVYENFDSYITYYQNSTRYGMIVGGAGEYPTSIVDSAVYVYIYGGANGEKELRVTGAIDLESAVVTDSADGEILNSKDTARLDLTQYGFEPDAASAYKTTTIKVNVNNGVLKASVDDIKAAIRVNLASTYVHGQLSLVATGCDNGGFKYLYVNELETTPTPEQATVNYNMTSKKEYAVVTVCPSESYSSLTTNLTFNTDMYEYVKATSTIDNERMSKISVEGNVVTINAYTNSSDEYINLYFKTKDGTQAKDFSGFKVNGETMKVVGGKDVITFNSSLTLEHDYLVDKIMNIADLISTDDAGNRTALRSVLVGKNTDTVSSLMSKSVLFLGDSIVNGNCDNIGWHGRLKTIYGMDAREVATDAATLVPTGVEGSIAIKDQLNTAPEGMNVVVLEGGANDVLKGTTVNKITEALSDLIVATKEKYPTSSIIYIVSSRFTEDEDDYNSYVEAVKQTCDTNKISYVDLSGVVMSACADPMNPNAKYYDSTTELVATKIQEELLKNQLKAYVYVDDEFGSDTNDGSKDTPFKTMSYAATRVQNNGTIEVVGTYEFTTEETSLGNASKAINVTGGALDIKGVNEFNLNGDVTLKELTFLANDYAGKEKTDEQEAESGAAIFANGHRFVIDDTVDFAGTTQNTLYGGSNRNSVQSTYLVLKSGNFTRVFGGCDHAAVNGKVYIFVGDNFNKGANENESMHSLLSKHEIFGGCVNNDVDNTEIIIDGEHAVVGGVYAGGYGSNAAVTNGSKVTLKDGNVYTLYGGGYHSTYYTKYNVTAEVYVKGGEVAQIFGGAYNANLKGSTYVEVTGGTVTRRIYGGCYNDANKDNSGTTLSWGETPYAVIGTTTVSLHEGATYPTKTSGEDNGICASSRWKENIEEEEATLKFDTEALYNKCKNQLNVLAAQGLELIVINVKGFDSLYVAGKQIQP